MSNTPKDDQGHAFADRPAAITAEAVLRRQALQREREAQRLAAPTQFMDPAPALEADTLWRSLSRNGELRLLVVRATQTVAEAARRLECSADVTRTLGELMIGTLLVRSTLNPDDQLQVTLEHQGPMGRVTVDAWREGGMRAYVAHPQEVNEAFGFLIGAGTLLVSRSAGVGVAGSRSYSSTTALDGDNVADYFMNYLLDSEQILSLLQTDVVVAADGTVQHAVGYLVQLMPEGTRGDIQKILENLGPLPPLHQAMTAADPDGRAWAGALLKGFGWDQCAREAVAFLCRCSRHRMLSMLSTLPKRDLHDLAAGSEPLELLCDYCRARYEVRPAELRGFLAEPS
ncbi:MAG: Hsp33 family molecular chaperone HslO [Deltaproteobacteria bacterium]|nr:Hsp33 family molecular chaperone HslO [Deltaproteobacteria bacterium]